MLQSPHSFQIVEIVLNGRLECGHQYLAGNRQWTTLSFRRTMKVGKPTASFVAIGTRKSPLAKSSSRKPDLESLHNVRHSRRRLKHCLTPKSLSTTRPTESNQLANPWSSRIVLKDLAANSNEYLEDFWRLAIVNRVASVFATLLRTLKELLFGGPTIGVSNSLPYDRIVNMKVREGCHWPSPASHGAWLNVHSSDIVALGSGWSGGRREWLVSRIQAICLGNTTDHHRVLFFLFLRTCARPPLARSSSSERHPRLDRSVFPRRFVESAAPSS